MCMGKLFHLWGKWQVVDEKAFISQSTKARMIVLTQKRVCCRCNYAEIDIKEILS